jgi:hypothetical protein
MGKNKLNYMRNSFNYFILQCCLLAGSGFHVQAQSSARDVRGPVSIVPLISEPPAKLIVDAPLKDQLQSGKVIIQYRTENMRIVPVYGQAALNVSPRIGHIHVTVDDGPWHWADASNEPIIIVGMTPGPHKILIELAGPTHKVVEGKTISFIIPGIKEKDSSHH